MDADHEMVKDRALDDAAPDKRAESQDDETQVDLTGVPSEWQQAVLRQM